MQVPGFEDGECLGCEVVELVELDATKFLGTFGADGCQGFTDRSASIGFVAVAQRIRNILICLASGAQSTGFPIAFCTLDGLGEPAAPVTA